MGLVTKRCFITVELARMTVNVGLISCFDLLFYLLTSWPSRMIVDCENVIK